ncbi:adenine phosphoribosyltransferase [Sphaerimonospora cavernae]|uniref:Adenine phosphoribosyltransferase n=1 Tax=Sphaerimonospora cavernae TaxID=1740611 RepID=A0ABV6U645_9ACTN
MTDWTALIRDVPDYPKPGILFKDITPLLADHAGFTQVVDELADGLAFDKVVGIEARGFILAAPVAYRSGAGFVPVRKKGKLPADTLEASYELEYGSAAIEVHVDAFNPGERVLIVDDVLATGGTAAATVELVRRAGAEVVAVSFLMELSVLAGRDRLPGLDVRTLVSV